MAESLIDYDNFIYAEMMVHPVLFTHHNAKKIAIINQTSRNCLLDEALKHNTLKEVCLVSLQPYAAIDKRVTYSAGELSTWPSHFAANTLDSIIISGDFLNATPLILKQYLNALTSGGILIHQSASLFELQTLKATCRTLQDTGFHDLQIMHFPQPSFPSGLRCAVMAMKDTSFKRVREKDIFNKTFTTRYYNFDTHKAALVMPEFMREEIVI